ncbi:MAG: efflux RND transporter periplasmic adaptor subunit [bacterium]|nr:efflux RND transporter periplasmic adaptor subunit [bacterium]
MTAEKSKVRRILVPAAIILGGFAIMFTLIASRKKPEQKTAVFPGVLVETTVARPDSHRAEITGTGTVRAKQEISLAPQVGGRVEWVSELFVSGGHFKRGELLCRIEEIDYQLAVEQAEARVAQAEVALAIEKAQADVARREWERMRDTQQTTTELPEALVLRGPQMKQAESNLASARASLRQAELARDRTGVRAPFDGRVKREFVDVGQMVAPGAQIAIIYSTDVAEIEVGIPLDELAWLELPGSTATVTLRAADQIFTWTGRVERTLGVLDSIGRLARVVVRVDNPYETRADGGPELAVGSFVSVAIRGKQVANVTPLPAHALRSGNIVWIATQADTLELRSVRPYFHAADSVFIGGELRAGERIVTSGINGAANGLKLRLAGGRNS